MTALRSIAVTVEEVRPGAFEWVLLEYTADWAPMTRSERPTKSYAKAMAAGLFALQNMVDDLDVGPREPETPTQPAAHSHFGFGFGLLK